MKTQEDRDFENWMNKNENDLNDAWNEYKYDKLMECFHYDDVDYFNVEQFEEMAYTLYTNGGM